MRVGAGGSRELSSHVLSLSLHLEIGISAGEEEHDMSEKRRRQMPEQIIRKLAAGSRLSAGGRELGEVCRHLEIAEFDKEMLREVAEGATSPNIIVQMGRATARLVVDVPHLPLRSPDDLHVYLRSRRTPADASDVRKCA